MLNELSILDVDAHQHDALSLVGTLTRLRDIVRPARLSMWRELRDPQTDAGHLFRERLVALRRMTQPARSSDRDAWRSANRLFDRAEDFTEELAEEAWFGRDTAHGLLGEVARGLGHAQRVGGLALSLYSADRWGKPTLPLTLFTLHPEADCENLRECQVNVRHAAEESHLAAHADWKPLEDADRLRMLLTSLPTTHRSASEYRRHVRGTTNEERLKNARQPRGQGQYLVERDGEQVTDTVICRWEEEVLDRVCAVRTCIVKYHGGNTFHVFCDMGNPIGYEGGTGMLITWVRVEWSSGTVHSHPRRPLK